MARNLVLEEQVKEALKINNFREISKEKIMEFTSLIPNMDKDVAIAIINQFPVYADSVKNMVMQLNDICDNVIKANNSSQKEAVDAYKLILQDLSERSKKNDISKEERDEITKEMIILADKIAELDRENKEFIMSIFERCIGTMGVLALVGGVMLGVNVKGRKLPSIKK